MWPYHKIRFSVLLFFSDRCKNLLILQLRNLNKIVKLTNKAGVVPEVPLLDCLLSDVCRNSGDVKRIAADSQVLVLAVVYD
jgi:hypothetical protein